MQTFASIVTLALALSVAAVPAKISDGDVTTTHENNVAPVTANCGNDLTISCCNTQVVGSKDLAGVLGLHGLDLLNGLAIFNGCNELSLDGGIGGAVHNILDSKCKGHTVCCQGISQTQSGFANVALPCLPVSVL
ncbi:hypothetical protein TWF694_001449 [Orbilia ellipsospora]|uniref:Hydrophobin n=1 Tax=Orbilia ellipsospora TaxID=2528407 RepID=A0AAV9XT40_9PEZI